MSVGPLILASQSAARRAMLSAAGVDYEVRPSPANEEAIKASHQSAAPDQLAMILAEAKAQAISVESGDHLVLGSDSLVWAAGRRFDKPRDRDDAAAHLRTFSGQEITLWSAAALARNGVTVWRHVEAARLEVRPLSARFIDSYLDAEWPEVAGCVGVFRIEGRGVQLFRHIEGSHFTVLGMPLLAVLEALREYGALPA